MEIVQAGAVRGLATSAVKGLTKMCYISLGLEPVGAEKSCTTLMGFKHQVLNTVSGKPANV